MKRNFTPSEYQKAFFEFLRTGVGNAVVNAKAGSGKTTTAVMGLDIIPESQKVLYVAFNKAIAEELKSRVKAKPNVDIRTYHSLGYAILRENLGRKVEVSPSKYRAHIARHISEYTDASPLTLGKSKFLAYKNNVKSLVDFARCNCAQSPKEIKELCVKYGLDIIYDEDTVIPKILAWGRSNTLEVDYTDMIWLCVELGLETRHFKFDFIFIDEAQDSSIVQQELIKKCYKRGGRFIAIGDEYQCINAFAGADQDAFRRFQMEPNTVVLDLPISYRCPKNVIYMAVGLGIDIQPREDAPDGIIREDVSPMMPVSGDMVLCRNTAPLIQLYMKYLGVNKKAYVKGKDIAENFKAYVESTGQENLSRHLKKDGVFPRLYERLFDMIDNVVSSEGLDLEDAVLTQKVVNMYDTIKSLETLSVGLNTSEELIAKIEAIITDDERDGVCLSTIHKAKGLEADNVFVACDSLLPSKFAKKAWEIEVEDNLRYVMITRAKKTLNFISEKEFPPGALSLDAETFIEELEMIKVEVERAIHGKESDVTLAKKYAYTNEDITTDVSRILNKKVAGTRVANSRRKNNVGGNRMSKFLK